MYNNLGKQMFLRMDPNLTINWSINNDKQEFQIVYRIIKEKLL
jgi:hypothetical protein